MKNDIASLKVDAIVNAANSSLLGGGGVDGRIHKMGGKEILEECMLIRNKQGGCKTGEAVITTAGKLPAKYVIHTVGPFWNGGKSNEVHLLQNCYIHSLELAIQHGVRTIAFPSISTGRYRFPKYEAAKIALSTVKNFSQLGYFEKVVFVCFGEEDYNIYKTVIKELD